MHTQMHIATFLLPLPLLPMFTVVHSELDGRS